MFQIINFVSSGKAATFTLYRTVLFPQAIQVMSVAHHYWYLCQANKIQLGYELKLVYTKTDEAYLSDCSFLFHPLPKAENPQENCKNVLEFPKPSIKNQHFPEESNSYSKVQPGKAIKRKGKKLWLRKGSMFTWLANLLSKNM